MTSRHATVLTFLGVALLAAGSADAQPFRHPGVVVNKAQLDFVKAKIQAGQQPWKAAFDKMKATNYASATYTPHPRADVECGSYSNPNNGCSEEREDAAAAYAHALLWSYTGNKADAEKTIQILNAWSAVLKTHSNSNAALQAGWAASLSVRAAEIIRHTYTGWAPADVERFGTMLRTAYLTAFPKLNVGTNGNWHLIILDAGLGISVFLDDRALFDSYVAKWRERTKAYIYITDDGPTPFLPAGLGKTAQSYWYGQTAYMDGLSQETCRDFGHTGYGLAAINTAAETALLQGLDLYGEQAKRIVAGMEFHAELILGKPAPSNVCGGKPHISTSPTWEVSYNHFANRKGIPMPFTKKLIETKVRPSGVDHHMAWESLTHAETGAAALAGSIGVLSQPTPGSRLSNRAQLVMGDNWRLQVVKPGQDGRALRFGLNGTQLPQTPAP